MSAYGHTSLQLTVLQKHIHIHTFCLTRGGGGSTNYKPPVWGVGGSFIRAPPLWVDHRKEV